MKNYYIRLIGILTALMFITAMLSGCRIAMNVGVKKNVVIVRETVEAQSVPLINTASIEEELSSLAKELAETEDLASITQKLRDFMDKSTQNIKCIYYGQEEGSFILIPSAQLPDDYDARTRPWYKAAQQDGKYISEPYADVTINKQIMSIAYHVEKDNKTIGVVGIDIELE